MVSPEKSTRDRIEGPQAEPGVFSINEDSTLSDGRGAHVNAGMPIPPNEMAIGRAPRTVVLLRRVDASIACDKDGGKPKSGRRAFLMEVNISTSSDLRRGHGEGTASDIDEERRFVFFIILFCGITGASSKGCRR